jgi:ketosteroid isomerase-like protein
MNDNAELIERLYRAFQARDGATMASLYAPDATFSDPVFTDLRGDDIGDMWKMLCERGRDLEVRFHSVEASSDRGRARWDASYTFSVTGRRVNNSIEAELTFRDGKIATHRDSFDLYRWCRQALGLKGALLGWLPPVQNAVRRQAAAGLKAWQKKRES